MCDCVCVCVWPACGVCVSRVDGSRNPAQRAGTSAVLLLHACVCVFVCMRVCVCLCVCVCACETGVQNVRVATYVPAASAE
jgi:hypothetical protein